MSAFRGEKVRLRALTIDDAEFLHRRAGLDSVGERLYDRINLPESLEDFKKKLGETLGEDSRSDNRNLAIETLSGEFVGEICVFDCQRRNGCFRCGFYILPEYRGGGLVSEALSMVLGFYFQEMNYQKCNNYVYETNLASRALHEKFGFELEGRITRSYFTEGRYIDVLYYGLKREAFQERFDLL